MTPRPRLTTDPLPTTTTIYKTVQCLFIGTMGYKYSTQREKGTLYTLIQYVIRTHIHTHTDRTQNTDTSAAALAWWWLWCSLQRQSGEDGRCLEGQQERDRQKGWQFTAISFRLLLPPLCPPFSFPASPPLCSYSNDVSVVSGVEKLSRDRLVARGRERKRGGC